MSIKKLRKAVKKRKDDFETGTVIRWTAVGRYTYAAIKTPIGWTTTARSGNIVVPQVVTFEELLDIVGRSDTSEVEIADSWIVVD